MLCAFTSACCPAQKFDEFTPDAWGLILEDIRFEDAKVAVVEIKKRSTWVDPSDIIREVRKVRAKRIDEHGPITPPADLDRSTSGHGWLPRSHGWVMARCCMTCGAS